MHKMSLYVWNVHEGLFRITYSSLNYEDPKAFPFMAIARASDVRRSIYFWIFLEVAQYENREGDDSSSSHGGWRYLYGSKIMDDEGLSVLIIASFKKSNHLVFDG
jgi:hypothetical protein